MMPFPTLEESVKISGSKTPSLQRIATIDILRALTMVLMIFVNDLGSLRGIPLWLEHVENGVDGIGLADVVFPAFLFIVGLSLPYAIDNRRSTNYMATTASPSITIEKLFLLEKNYIVGTSKIFS